MTHMVFGVTGRMGSGKTHVIARIDSFLRQRGQKLDVISIDDIRRDIIEGRDDEHESLRKQVMASFGLNDLNRKNLAERLRGDGYEKLWNIIGSAVRERVRARIGAAGCPVALEWPRLVEDGFAEMVASVLIIDTPQDVLNARFHASDLTREQIGDRWSRQMEARETAARLDGLGIRHKTVSGAAEPAPGMMEDICGFLGLDEYDPDTSFCLFRIPRRGGRVIWEITNACNYGCRYCIFSSTTHQKTDELDTRLAKETIDQLKDCGFSHIKFTGGEPFLRPDMTDLMAHARERGLICDISTNASLITPEIADRLAALKPEMVHVSFDGHTQALQEAVRGKNTYAPTLAGLRLLTGRGIYIRIGCLIYRNNQDSLGDMAEFCRSLGCDEVIFSLMEPVGRMRGQTALLSSRPVAELQAEIEKLRREYAGKIKVSGNFAETVREGCGRCPGGARFLSIDHRGRISPCPWVAESLPTHVSGESLHGKSLRALLEGAENTRFRSLVTAMAASGLNRCPMQDEAQLHDIEALIGLFSDPSGKLAAGGRHGAFSPIYAFSTENLAGSFAGLDLSGKRVLTIGGAGDQMIAAHAAGALSVENIDISRLAKYWAELKLAALQELNWDDFMRFMDSFAPADYARLSGKLSLPARFFFDAALAHFRQDGAAFRQSEFFRTQQDRNRLRRNIPHLADPAAHDRAKRAAQGKPLCWHSMEIGDFAGQATGEWDVILLSNVSDYAHRRFKGDYLAAFRKKVADPLFEHLAPGGCMMLGYVYDARDIHGSSRRSLINQPEARKKAFGRKPGCRYRETEIPGAWEDGNSDTLLLWSKA